MLFYTRFTKRREPGATQLFEPLSFSPESLDADANPQPTWKDM